MSCTFIVYQLKGVICQGAYDSSYIPYNKKGYFSALQESSQRKGHNDIKHLSFYGRKSIFFLMTKIFQESI